MKPVDQTILVPPLGNCYAACIASIFGVPLESVPQHRAEEMESGQRWADYEERLRKEFFGPRGLSTLLLRADEEFTPMGYTILSAQSPRGDFEHAVVCLDGEIVHDPHPQRHMGVGDKVLWIIFQVLDPEQLCKP